MSNSLAGRSDVEKGVRGDLRESEAEIIKSDVRQCVKPRQGFRVKVGDD